MNLATFKTDFWPLNGFNSCFFFFWDNVDHWARMKHITDEGRKFSDEKFTHKRRKKTLRGGQESSAKSFIGNGMHVFSSVSSPHSLP